MIHQWVAVENVIDLIKINTRKSSRHGDKDHPGGVQSISELHQDSPKVKCRMESWDGVVKS